MSGINATGEARLAMCTELLAEPPMSGGKTAMYVGLSVLLIATAGMMSGLTLGFFSLDPLKLKLLESHGTDAHY